MEVLLHILKVQILLEALLHILKVQISLEAFATYLKTSDFNSTSTSLVNTTNAQTINGEKIFSNSVLIKNGRGSIKDYPPNGNVGPATFHTYRYSDQASPSQGDHWEFGNDLVSGCLLYTSPSPRDLSTSRMPSSA